VMMFLTPDTDGLAVDDGLWKVDGFKGHASRQQEPATRLA
jgi:hypothetical protein